MSDTLTAPVDSRPAGVATVATALPRVRRRRILAGGVVVSVLVIVAVLGFALFPQLFTTQDPIDGVPRDKLLAPSADHWFGTDHLGRDVFTRVVYGARLSLMATAVAVVFGFVVGTTLGIVAGYRGGVVDSVLMRIVDVLLAVPGLLLSLTIVVALGFGTLNVAIAVGVGAVASFARLMRAEVMRIRQSEYIEASIAFGRSWRGVLVEHVVPNASGSVLVLAALEFGSAILAISSLSFLGFGAQPPDPEWGQLVSDGRNYLATSWWLTTLPGLVVVLVVLSVNRIGRALERDGVRR